MTPDNIQHLGIKKWDSRRSHMSKHREVFINKDGRLLSVRDNDKLQTHKHKATREILRNSLGELNRASLIDRKLKNISRIDYNHIQKIALCINDDREKLIDHIYHFLKPSLSEMPITVRQALRKIGLSSRDQAFGISEIYNILLSIDTAKETNLCEALLPKLKTNTLKCMMLGDEITRSAMKNKFQECLNLLNQESSSDKDQNEKWECIHLLASLRNVWEKIPEEKWKRAHIETDVNVRKTSRTAQDELERELDTAEEKQRNAQHALHQHVMLELQKRFSSETGSHRPASQEKDPSSLYDLRSQALEETRNVEVNTEETAETGQPEAADESITQSTPSIKLEDIPLPGNVQLKLHQHHQASPSYQKQTHQEVPHTAQSTLQSMTPESTTANLTMLPKRPPQTLAEEHPVALDTVQGGAKPKIRKPVETKQAQPTLLSATIVDQRSFDNFLIDTCNKAAILCDRNRDALDAFLLEDKPDQENTEEYDNWQDLSNKACTAAIQGFWSASYLESTLDGFAHKDPRLVGMLDLYRRLNRFEEGIPPYDDNKKQSYCDTIISDGHPIYILRADAIPSEFVKHAEMGPYPLLIHPFQYLQLQFYKAICNILGDDLFNHHFKKDEPIRLLPTSDSFEFHSNLIQLTTSLHHVNKPTVGNITCWQCPTPKNTKYVDKWHTLFAICTNHKKGLYTIPGMGRGLTAAEIEKLLADTLQTQKTTIDELHRQGGGLQINKTFRFDYGKIKSLKNSLQKSLDESTTKMRPRTETVPLAKKRTRYKKQPASLPVYKSSSTPQAVVTTETTPASSDLKTMIQKELDTLKQETRKYKKSGQPSETLGNVIETLKTLSAQIDDSAELDDDTRKTLKRQTDSALKNAPKIDHD